MVSFLAVYRGKTLEAAELVAVSTDPALVGYVAARLLKGSVDSSAGPEEKDEALEALRDGERKALESIRSEAFDLR